MVVLAAVFALKPFEAVHRGLFCDDETIRYPFREDTISVTVLVLTSVLPVAVLVSAAVLSSVLWPWQQWAVLFFLLCPVCLALKPGVVVLAHRGTHT